MIKQNSPRIFTLSLVFCLFSFSLFSNNGGDSDKTDENLAKEEKLAQIKLAEEAIVAQLYQLKDAKKQATSRQDKRAIRHEAKALKAELNALYAQGRDISGGVYIGTGTLIVILLLILLL